MLNPQIAMSSDERQAPTRFVSGRRRFMQATGSITATGLLGVPGHAAARRSGRGGGNDSPELSVVGSFPDFHVTGVAVSGDGRVFVNQPRFPWAVTDQGNKPRDADNVDISVAELRGGHGNSLIPYPSENWNQDGWDQDADEWDQDAFPAADHFVNVQSVYIDPENPQTLWVLDTGNPELSSDGEGVVEDGPKLLMIDLESDSVVKKISYDDRALTPEHQVDEPGAGDDANTRTAYLNDVRVTSDQQWAFMTDSELGALVVTDLEASDADTTEAWRLFDDPDKFHQTHDEDVSIPVGPHEAQEAPLPIADVHSDGIAIDDDDEYVYFHSLSGYELYRSTVSDLTTVAEADIDIQNPARTDATDGMIADDEGVYHTNLEDDSITRWNFESGDGTESIVQNSHWIHWPDSFAFGPDGDLYFTTSKIHLEATGTRRRPFRVLKIKNRHLS